MALPAPISKRIPPDLYQWWVGKGMDRAYGRALRAPSIVRLPVEVDELRAVVFSDHHRGNGDSADDFRRCEESYAAALGWYLEEGHELWLLGDVEELWKNRADEVMERYATILALEAQFGDRLKRFYGNHDLAWRSREMVRRHLPGTTVHEAMSVTITDHSRPLGSLFLVHGHQGTIDSGNLLVLPISRFVVRFIWGKLQRWRGYPNTSPAEDALLRHRHDQVMAHWADHHAEPLVLVAGHTHHPVFHRPDPLDFAAEARRRAAEYAAAKAAGEGAPAARAAKELARIRAEREQRYDPPELHGWSYFNGGCCSFADGDITGLEFADGEVRLVRWPGDKMHPAPEILLRRPLREVFSSLAQAEPSAAGAAQPALERRTEPEPTPIRPRDRRRHAS